MRSQNVKFVKLGELTTLISSGSTPKGGAEVYLKEGPVMLIRSQNVLAGKLSLENVAYVTNEIDSQMNRSRLEMGDVLLNITGASIGRSACFNFENTKANVNQHVCVIRPIRTRLDSKYLTHLINSISFQEEINRIQHGGTRQALTFSQIADFRILLPSLDEQRRIAEILDRAEALRAKRREAIAKLDELKQAIFIDMFGDERNNFRGMPQKSVSDYVLKFQGGKSIEAEADESIVTRNRVLKVSAVTGMNYCPDESKPVPENYNPPEEHFVRSGDLLFSRANTTSLVGAVAYVKGTPSNLLLPDKLWRFVWRDQNSIEPLFVWALFQTPSVRRELEKRATGTSSSMKNISQEKVFGIKTILPPISLQKEFARRANMVDKLSEVHLKFLDRIIALADSCHSFAFTGNL